MSFLRRVAGLSLRDRVRSSAIREELRVESLLLRVERSQMRWLGHLVRMPPGRLPGEVFRACPSGRRPPGRPRTRWRDYVSRLAWERLGIPPDELEEVAGEREVWASLLRLLPPATRISGREWMDGWMDIGKGPTNLMWRDVARCVFRRVSNLGLDDALFLTDFKFAKLNGLPPFYQSVVKAWALFKVEKRTSSDSLYWLIRKPTVHGARLDVSAEATPRLTAALWRTLTLLFQQVVAVAGPDLTGAEAVGSLLGIRSTQAAEGGASAMEEQTQHEGEGSP
ncbi:hypothetical protein D4764_11G0003200 [Takifugu flavidus]|uniref:Uncharacterized protein n=1 Tax=Takifugu flavidus TaxID=433684 RepID=A0A5C6PH07_9TELE|nr:hypothetical protein D4764_11G0003200 [Takifugu flavidus]